MILFNLFRFFRHFCFKNDFLLYKNQCGITQKILKQAHSFFFMNSLTVILHPNTLIYYFWSIAKQFRRYIFPTLVMLNDDLFDNLFVIYLYHHQSKTFLLAVEYYSKFIDVTFLLNGSNAKLVINQFNLFLLDLIFHLK